MPKPEAGKLSSNPPDPQILNALGVVHRGLLALVTALSAISLLGWLIPSLGRLIPLWGTTKANNAFMILLCSVAIFLSEPRRTKNVVDAGRVLAGIATLFAGFLIFERVAGITLPIDTFLAADAFSPHPGRVSVEGCITLLLLGFVVVNLRARGRRMAYVVDGTTLCIIFLMLAFASRYVFGLMPVPGEPAFAPMSLQTFVCLSILTWLVVNRRAEYGALSVLLGSQIGAKTARYAAPCALLLPFIFAFGRIMVVRFHLLSETSSTAAATSLLSVFAFFLVLALSRKTNELEDAIRNLSIRDELTSLYNRRGFYVLAEQALLLAQRAGEPFFVLFIDVDDLKKTNDTLGHDAGSELLCATAILLQQTFRETDVIGRIGGDEFVVAGRVDSNDAGSNPVYRLEQAVIREAYLSVRQFPLSFSLGYVQSDPNRSENLEQLLQRADMIMYAAKRNKKRKRSEAAAAQVPVTV
jgi:diguanylate cyclase (GGDEF)-like protein